MVIKRIDVVSAAKVAGAIYCALGLLFGAIFAVVALAGAGFARSAGANAPAGFFGLFFGVGAIIFLPIFYGCMGALMAAFTAWIYNTVVRLTGGLRIDVD